MARSTRSKVGVTVWPADRERIKIFTRSKKEMITNGWGYNFLNDGKVVK